MPLEKWYVILVWFFIKIILIEKTQQLQVSSIVSLVYQYSKVT